MNMKKNRKEFFSEIYILQNAVHLFFLLIFPFLLNLPL